MALPSRSDHHRRQIDPVHVRLRRKRTRDIGFSDDSVLDQKIDNVVLTIQMFARALNLLA